MAKTILIADDDKGIVDAVSTILDLSGYNVLHVDNGTSVIEAVKAKPDLILLDIKMPGHDGQTVCRQLKRQASTKKIPVMIISGMPDLERTAIDIGADGFIAKPFDMYVLQDKVSAM